MPYDSVTWQRGVTEAARIWHLLLVCGFPFSINLSQRSGFERLAFSLFGLCFLLGRMTECPECQQISGFSEAFGNPFPSRLLGGVPGIGLVLCETSK